MWPCPLAILMDPCRLCPRVHTCLPPDGPPSGGLLFIGESPNKEEQKRGRIFVGRTGREVDDHYLPLAGLRRPSVRFINAIACLPTTSGHKLDIKRPADYQLLQSCANTHLYPAIVEQEPSLLVPMGAFACRAVDPRIDLELHHGRPFQTALGYTAFPMYHPALGMHSPKQMLYIRTDWIRLKEYLRGTLRIPTDDYPEPDYAEVTTIDELEALDPTRPMGCDTETSRSVGAYCFTFTQEMGMGRLIRASRTDLLAALNARIRQWQSLLLFHFWLHDAPVCRDLGLALPPQCIRDTGLLAFHLGNLPQGLKVASYRELGMEMQDFMDLVQPYSAKRTLDYYHLLQMTDWPKPEPRAERDSKTGEWKMKKPQGMSTKLKRFFTDYSKNPEKDPIAMWDNWEESHEMLEAQCGAWPGLDIAHVPFEEMLHYACRDPDATLRLWHREQQMRARVGSGPQESWAG